MREVWRCGLVQELRCDTVLLRGMPTQVSGVFSKIDVEFTDISHRDLQRR